MAGRNIKTAADYFPHDADASSDEKIVYLESVFGHTGYALYFKFLERMTRSEGFKLEWNDIKKAVYASEFHISVTEIDRFITECCRKEIKAFIVEEMMLFSPGLIKRMRPLIDKREYNRLKYEEKKIKENKSLPIPEDTIPISVTEITQSKEKKSKEKESKEKNNTFPQKENSPHLDGEEETKECYLTKKKRKLTGKHLETFEMFWKAFDYKKDKSSAADSWLDIKGLSPKLVNLICKAAEIEAENRPGLIAKGRTPIYAQGWLTARRWEDELQIESKPKIKTIAERKQEEIETFGHLVTDWDEIERLSKVKQ